ncbi:MAG0490 family ComEA-like DNA-binding protein [Metamycoplasma sualvi]|uniref:MAG0490 family ComEA-like DNA-binding protein n=1 Tax=Metamycoplasma sualvi TaxID=2125 RepID=UPI0038738477
MFGCDISDKKEISIKIRKKIILLSCFGILAAGVVSYSIYKIVQNDKKNYSINFSYQVNVEGAVNNPGVYEFNKPKKVREILFQTNVQTNADLDSMDLEKIIDYDYDIIVPYKVGTIKKIKWKDLNSVEQLTNLGIKNSVAQTIINHRRQNEVTTWEEILALKGIGPVTLAQLKDIIDLF